MPANLWKPVSLLTVTGQAMTKSAYPLQNLFVKCGRNKVEQVSFKLFWAFLRRARGGFFSRGK